MNKTLFATCFAALLSTTAIAETTPSHGEFDPRVRTIEYNQADVTKLVTFYGVSTHIGFGKNEKIVDIAVGDPEAWELIPRISNLYIRPLAENPDANLTIITDKHSYQFTLFTAKRSNKDKTAWQDPNLIYSLQFTYKKEEAERDLLMDKYVKTQEKLKAAETALKTKQTDLDNLDYWVAGHSQVSPTEAKDDGRFIFLTFSNNRDIPAIYEVDEFGEETLINTNVNGNTVVVHRMVKQLRLRKGNYVACLINRSFDLDAGKDNTTGTIATEVKRIIKESK